MTETYIFLYYALSLYIGFIHLLSVSQKASLFETDNFLLVTLVL